MPRTSRGEGLREPERPRMAILSEMLQFKHHTCARGRTVEKAFLVDLATALGIANPARRTKVALLGAIYTAATGLVSPPAGHDGSIYSAGGTVTEATLQKIIDGVRECDLAKVSLVDGAAAARISRAEQRIAEAADRHALRRDDDDTADPEDVVPDESSFHYAVLGAYGTTCAITRCNVQEVLEATVIHPEPEHRFRITNGICLRADLRRLWETGRLAVHEATHHVLLDEKMIGTEYGLDAGVAIRVPENARHVPSSVSLQLHREWCGL
jgi:hypothetical protein